MRLLKSLLKQTPETKAAEHLYQARMNLLDAQMALDHYNALVVSLKSSVQRLEDQLKAEHENTETIADLTALYSRDGECAHSMDHWRMSAVREDG